MRHKLALLSALLTLPAALLLTLMPAASAAAMKVRSSIGELYVRDAKPKQSFEVLGTNGKLVARRKADRYGSIVFHELKQGATYSVRTKGKVVKRLKTLKADIHPPASFYKKKKLVEGLNYLEMRDGIKIAVTVRLPGGKKITDGPFPTVIEYSGYQTAAPGNLLASLGKNDPLAPAQSTIVGGALLPLVGFASVSVQMRGSGCSGGHFDLFDLPTTYDGYDVIESLAAQPWVKNGMVGMAGISFSGISQMFVAGTRPPHLAAISPMSITDDLYRGTGLPGGIFNSGFALSWLQERIDDAQPAPQGGQPWARELVKRGDKDCIENQRMRLQTQNPLKLLSQNPFRTPSLHNDRSPSTWMPKINVPTFLVGAFNDEQTSGHFPASLGELADNDRVWLTLQNGVHVDALGPSTATRWIEFLKLYVADEIPVIPQDILGLSDALYGQVAPGAAALPIKQSRFANFTSTAEARAVFEKDARVTLLMDNGATDKGLGSIGAAWQLEADEWPIAAAQPTSYFLGKGGSLSTSAPGAGSDEYLSDPKARPDQTLGGSDEGAAWAGQPPYNWTPIPAGKGLGWTTPQLGADVVIAGSSSFDVYLKSSAKDTDLQVTLSEVMPDGNERYIQNGWLRASHRKLAASSTANAPVQTHLEQDAAPMPAGKYELVRVPIFPVAYAFRAGSRIRVTLNAPGGDRPRWRFATIEKGKTRNAVSFGGAQASKLVLPVWPGATAKGTPLPAPTALRGMPARTYAPASNGG